jgi:hypothetical protein
VRLPAKIQDMRWAEKRQTAAEIVNLLPAKHFFAVSEVGTTGHDKSAYSVSYWRMAHRGLCRQIGWSA